MSKKPTNGKEETPLQIMLKMYPKRIARASLTPYKQFDEAVKNAFDDDGSIDKLHLWEQTTPETLEILFDCFKKAKVLSIRSLRLWKINAGDIGLKAVCDYLAENTDLLVLDMLDNGITNYGCQYLGALFGANASHLKIKKLMFDHNNIGDDGLKFLCDGLRKSPYIEELSLSYCGLGPQAANYLQQLIMNIDTKLEVLNIQGNSLGAEGCYQLLRALELNKKLKVVNISDNQIGEEKLFVDQLTKALETNNFLHNINISYNGIYQDTARLLLEIQKKKKQTRIDLTDRFDYAFSEEYNTFMSKIKPKTVKRGKKKPAARK